jgi:hypothetical protein
MTAAHVRATPPGPERDQAIDAWCAAVWLAFSESHRAVAELLKQHRYGQIEEQYAQQAPAKARRTPKTFSRGVSMSNGLCEGPYGCAFQGWFPIRFAAARSASALPSSPISR